MLSILKAHAQEDNQFPQAEPSKEALPAGEPTTKCTHTRDRSLEASIGICGTNTRDGGGRGGREIDSNLSLGWEGALGTVPCNVISFLNHNHPLSMELGTFLKTKKKVTKFNSQEASSQGSRINLYTHGMRENKHSFLLMPLSDHHRKTRRRLSSSGNECRWLRRCGGIRRRPTATTCSRRHELVKGLLWDPGYWQALWCPWGLTFSVSRTGRTCPPFTLKARKPNTLSTKPTPKTTLNFVLSWTWH